MKMKDIRVGEDYAVGSESYSQRKTVLKVGVYGRVSSPGGWSTHTSDKPNYVQLVGHKDFRVARTILRPWAEQEVINAERLAQSHARAVEKKRVRRLSDVAPELLEVLKELLEKGDFYGSAIELDTGHLSIDGHEWEERARTIVAKAEATE